MKTSKTHNASPLPFMGQKRRFIKKFKDLLLNHSPDAVYVDLFGGSGLLSHTVKQLYPKAKVIYNDYDNFNQRLQHIDQTNKLIADLREIVKDLPKEKAIPNDRRSDILDRVKLEEDTTGYVDYITLSSNLLFSMNYAHSYKELERQTFYTVLRESPYNADGYLSGVDRVCLDYKELFNIYKDQPYVVFLVDPPYLSTDSYVYKSSHWKLGDYLDVLNVLDVPHYFYFTSNKSHIIELCEWMERKVPNANPFKHCAIYSHVTNPSISSSYTDIMIVK
ncbi:DNA adenine methylase [Sphingobacterium spiritivorum]|uniref:DNA adenine methylase n=1 Tax=Sphingobacterium spiritivorum TaxID=258 RepID=UPI003F75C8B5